MKIVMSFLFAALFSASASAATLTLVGQSFTGAGTQALSPFNTNVLHATSNGFAQGTWSSLYTLTSDQDLDVSVEWSVNPETAISASTLVFHNQTFTEKNFNAVFSMVAGFQYTVGFLNVTSTSISYDISFTTPPPPGTPGAGTPINAVPVPAAALLFAPALMGLMAVRRKANKSA